MFSLTFIGLLGFFVIGFYEEEGSRIDEIQDTAPMLSRGMPACFVSMVVRFYIDQKLRFLKIAHKCQRHEFKKHLLNEIVMGFVLILSMCILFV